MLFFSFSFVLFLIFQVFVFFLLFLFRDKLFRCFFPFRWFRAGFGRSCEWDVSELCDCSDLLVEEDVELSELSESSDELNSCNSRFRCGLTKVAVAEEEDFEQHSFSNAVFSVFMFALFLKSFAHFPVASMPEAYWWGFENNVLATDRWVAVRNSAAPTSIASSMKASVCSSAPTTHFKTPLTWSLVAVVSLFLVLKCFKFSRSGFSFFGI